MNLEHDKLLRFLKAGYAKMFIYEMKHGIEWAKVIEDKNAFDKALDNMIELICCTGTPAYDRLDIYSQCLERKKVV